MPSGKDRVYVALHVRSGAAKMPGGEDKYHWAILVGPKVEEDDSEGRRFHAKEMLVEEDGGGRWVWEFDERVIPMAQTMRILVRIVVGKIEDMGRLESVIRSTAIKGGEPGWDCVVWVKEALEGLKADGKALGTSVIDWSTVRDAAMAYVEEKKAQHRFDGQGQFDRFKVATWSLLTRKEVTA